IEACTLTKDGKKIPNYISAALFSEEGRQYIAGIGIDISERKKAEKALVESEEKFRNLFETTVQGIIYIDAKGDVVSANAAAAEILGASEKEILSNNIYNHWNVIDENGSEITNEEFPMVKSLRTGKTITNVILGVYNYKEERYRWLNVSSSARFRAGEKKPFQVYVTLEDITEQKKAEHALRDSEEKYRTMFDTMTQGVIYVNEKGQITSANDAAEKISGISSAEAKGKTIAELNVKAVHEDGSDFPVETRPVQVALRTGTQIKNKVMAILNRKEKRYRWVKVTAIPKFRAGEDKPFQVYATAEDITEEKEAEREQAKLSAVVETTPDFAGLADENARAIYVNKAGRKMTGISETGDITKYKIFDFHPRWAAEKVQKEGIPEAIEKGSWSGETAILDREGKITPVLQVILSHKNPDGSIAYFSTIAHDISERKKAEKAQARLTAILEATPDLVGIADENANAIYLNEAGRQMTGKSLEEDITKYKIPDFHPKWAAKKVVEEGLPEAIKKGIWKDETALLAPDGKEIPVSQVIIAHKREDGSIEYLSTIMRDISERKKAEKSIEEERAFASTLINGLREGFAVIDKDGTQILVNDELTKMTGFSKKELLNQKPPFKYWAKEGMAQM
ncbi:hypothetical protein LCGC14_2199960, partial [marine sediment metagenome]